MFLGGKGASDFVSGDKGPWDLFELVDSAEKGAEVGVRRIDDPLAPLFTP